MAPTYSFEQVICFTEDKYLGAKQLNSLIKLVHSEKYCYSKDDFYIINLAFYAKAKNILEKVYKATIY